MEAPGGNHWNRELPLVPFIDCLLCLVAFLLVTAVWSEMARLDVKAHVPGVIGPSPEESAAPVLHVDMRRGDRFVIEWRQGNVVVTQEDVPRGARVHEDGVLRFPELATRVKASWDRNGTHRAPRDAVHDRAVLHASNAAVFEEIVAGMDAIHATVRPLPLPDRAPGPAFDVVFAVD